MSWQALWNVGHPCMAITVAEPQPRVISGQGNVFIGELWIRMKLKRMDIENTDALIRESLDKEADRG